MLIYRSLCFVLLILFGPASAAETRPPFDAWIEGIKRDALAQGISAETVALLDGVEPDPRVIEFDRRQPEFVQTFEEYLDARVTDDRIDTARRYYRENRDTLERIGRRYGVDPQYLVAFWGLESSFGRYQGTYSVVRSLATLAHDQRRSTFFTGELMDALRILDEGHVEPDEFVGGWAGAMGQNQFLPSSFLMYAQDYDGDGKKNIWSSREDVWASIANYLGKNGWQQGAGWGTRVRLTVPLDFDVLKPKEVAPGCRALRSHTKKLTVDEWQSLGLKGDLASLPETTYALVIPDDGYWVSYLAGGNFRAILSYNCANKYAVSVGLLADLIVEGD